jgi:hypothetical protein
LTLALTVVVQLPITLRGTYLMVAGHEQHCSDSAKA